MSMETSKEFDEMNHKSPTLIDSPDSNNSSIVDPSSFDTLCRSDRSSLPTALCSHDVARQSRELVDEYLNELGSNPDQAVSMVNEYLDTPTKDATAFTSSIHAIKNRRTSMEDRHVIIHNLNKALNLDLPKNYSYYAIFDGHAGIDAASYSTAHLHHYLVESEAFRNGQMEEAFREAFEKTDSLYIKRCKEDGVDKLKPSGTTALCALIEDNKTVYLAWAGDSQAVLVRNGCHEEIMLPHKPDLESEKIRIQDQGGFVIYMDTWRVNGILSVTRAIGDPEHKALIIAEPSFSTFEIDSSLDFLVLGCDGLFDHLTGQDITSHVFEFLCKNENSDPEKVIQGVSAYLSEMAVNEGSNDNITAIVIFFKPFEQLISTGFPMPNENQELTMSNVVDSGSTTELPTTNGGHFPYTDFAELPIGTNYKLTSEEFTDSLKETPLEENNLANITHVPIEQQDIDSIMEHPNNIKKVNLEENVVCEDLGEERCQDEFDFVGTSVIEQQQVSQESQQVSEELDIQSSMITVDKPEFIMEATTFEDVDHNNAELAINKEIMFEQQQQQKICHDESDPNEIYIKQIPNDKNILTEEFNGEKSPPIMDNNNPFMDFSTVTPIIEQQQISPLLMNDDVVKSPSNVDNPLDILEKDLSCTVINNNDQQPMSTFPNPSSIDFCYVNSINESSTIYPVENLENNSCSMISPMLLKDSQLESGVLYNQNGISDSLNENGSQEELLGIQKTDLFDGQVINTDTSYNTIDHLKESQSEQETNLISENRSPVENFNQKDLIDIDDSTDMKNGKEIDVDSKVYEPVVNLIDEAVGKTETKNDFDITTTTPEPKVFDILQSIDTGSQISEKNDLFDSLPKKNEELLLNHEENQIEKNQIIECNVEEKILDNNEMQSQLVSQDPEPLIEATEISNELEKLSESVKPSEPVKKGEVESKKASPNIKDKTVSISKAINNISKLSKTAATGTKATATKSVSTTKVSSTTAGSKLTSRTTTTVPKTSVTKTTTPMTSTTSSARLTAKSTINNATNKINANTVLKTETKKPVTSVTSKLNTRSTISSTSRQPVTSTKTKTTTSVDAASKPTAPRSTISTIKTSKPLINVPKSSTRLSTVKSTVTKPNTGIINSLKKPAINSPSVGSKVASLRTAGTTTVKTTLSKPTTLKSPSTVSSTKPVGIKSTVIKKTTTTTTAENKNTANETKKIIAKTPNNKASTTTTTNMNGTPASKPPTIPKRTNIIGVENSLKQELEDAVMNEKNAAIGNSK